MATLVRTIFAQPNAEVVAAQLGRVTEQLERLFPAAVELVAGVTREPSPGFGGVRFLPGAPTKVLTCSPPDLPGVVANSLL